jgi:hypothetical protein
MQQPLDGDHAVVVVIERDISALDWRAPTTPSPTRGSQRQRHGRAQLAWAGPVWSARCSCVGQVLLHMRVLLRCVRNQLTLTSRRAMTATRQRTGISPRTA